jgi:hypothetical protein
LVSDLIFVRKPRHLGYLQPEIGDHGSGAHDDVANAVAGAVLSATVKKPTASIGFGGPGYAPVTVGSFGKN